MSISSNLDYTDGGRICEYINHPLGWTNNLMDGFPSNRCEAEAVFQTRDSPRRYLCARHATRKRVMVGRANDPQLQHMLVETI